VAFTLTLLATIMQITVCWQSPWRSPCAMCSASKLCSTHPGTKLFMAYIAMQENGDPDTNYSFTSFQFSDKNVHRQDLATR
jgi:hypothetical protein